MKYCGDCKNWKCRCESCPELYEGGNGDWLCECYNAPCHTVADCDEWNVSVEDDCGNRIDWEVANGEGY